MKKKQKKTPPNSKKNEPPKTRNSSYKVSKKQFCIVEDPKLIEHFQGDLARLFAPQKY